MLPCDELVGSLTGRPRPCKDTRAWKLEGWIDGQLTLKYKETNKAKNGHVLIRMETH